MKNLKVLGYALLLLCGILLYLNLYHYQKAPNDAVVIQQVTEVKSTVAGEKYNTAQKSVQNRTTLQAVKQRNLAEQNSPRTVSNVHNRIINTNNKQANELFTDHNDIDFYDVQTGPDHAFSQDVYRDTDQYSGANQKLDKQLLENDDLIIAQQKLMHDIENKYNVIHQKIETSAYLTSYRANKINEAIKKINENYEQANNQLQALYNKEGRIMAARKGAYQQRQALLVQKGASLFQYPTMNIKTKVASQYNKIDSTLAKSTLAKANAISFPAAKPVKTSSSDLTEVD